jgi:myosin X
LILLCFSHFVLIGSYALDQMLSSGVMETIMIRKAGFGYRILFSDFVNSYRLLVRNCPTDLKEAVKTLTSKKLESETFEIGRSKVFLRDEAKVRESLLILFLVFFFSKNLLDSKMDQLRKKAALLILRAIWRAKFKVRMEEFCKHAMKEKRKREEAERRRLEEERKRKEEEERKRKEEEERKRKEEEERKRKEEEERKRKEAERKREEEEEEERQRKQKAKKLMDAQKQEDEKKKKEQSMLDLRKRAQTSLGKSAGLRQMAAELESTTPEDEVCLKLC